MSSPQPSNPLVSRLMPLWGIVPLFFGVQSAYSIVQAYQIAEQQDSWIPTTAVVTEAWIRRTEDDYECYFTYRYVVDNKPFRSSRYASDGRACDGERKFRRGDSIKAYYNPENPKLAVVEKLSPSPFFVLATSIICLFCLALASIWVWMSVPVVLTKLRINKAP